MGSGLEPPSPPCHDLILAPAKPPETRPQGAEFLRFFGACGAKSWGGGGAPPTTLILLRNQRRAPPASRHRVGRRIRQLQPASASEILPKNAKFLLFSVVVESWRSRGGARWGAAIRCANVSHVRSALRFARPCPFAEVLTDGFRGVTHQVLRRSNVLYEVLPDLAGHSSRRAAFGSRKRPPPSRNLTVLRGLPSLL